MILKTKSRRTKIECKIKEKKFQSIQWKIGREKYRKTKFWYVDEKKKKGVLWKVTAQGDLILNS